MPYFFLISGLPLKGTDLNRLQNATSMNNGVLEEEFWFEKRNTPKNVLPDVHIMNIYPVNRGKAVSYLEAIQSLKPSRKRQYVEAVDKPVDDLAEENKYECGEQWNKARQSFAELKNVKHTGYQAKTDIEKKPLLMDNGKKRKQTKENTCPLVKIGGYALYQMHFKALEAKVKSKAAWLHDETIEAYLKLLNSTELLIITARMASQITHEGRTNIFNNVSCVSQKKNSNGLFEFI